MSLEVQESYLREALQEKNLTYILDFLLKECGRSLKQIFDSSRRNILYQQLEYINNHEDNDDHIEFEPFDIQDFICIVSEIDEKFNNNSLSTKKSQIISSINPHSVKFEEYKYKLLLKKNDLKNIIDLKTKWMKLLIDEKKNDLLKQIENKYNYKLNKLHKYDKEMITISTEVQIQYNKFNQFNNTNNHTK